VEIKGETCNGGGWIERDSDTIEREVESKLAKAELVHKLEKRGDSFFALPEGRGGRPSQQSIRRT